MADWYLRSNGANIFDPNSYTFVGSSAPACPGNGYVCAVRAEDNGSGLGKPNLTPALQYQITIALSTGVDQQDVLLRSLP
ncbi:hypothetical protein [Pedobacter sp. FW305-3-2-15-E-R2A2]|uniref:hypothetical protein n=1 Tax=Pedobacter sp. FW305-3-2-15-E-R2A2 TaxID=3140251 RepID=UPI00314026A7